ncbi:MAG: RHS repeat-associated core domain-containing protein [Candidatus Gracilibacteria bacterium]|nr:RHS repeat-associated core domain-containing protein [Candidatus Gracilibacteria bacterium]
MCHQRIGNTKFGLKIGSQRNKDDHLGGSNLDTNINGDVLQITDYLPYEKERLTQQNSSYKNKYGFGGKEKDSESDLQYFEARYYNNGLGRFTSQDRVHWEVGQTKRGIGALSDPQSLNSYSYARNNPVILTDPSGEWLESSDATSMFKTYMDQGADLNYNIKYTYEGPIKAGPVTILKKSPFKTMSDTLPSYLAKTAPGSVYDIKRSEDFMWMKNGKGEYTKLFDQMVQINGKDYKTNELGNFLVGLNGNRAGLSLKEINNYGWSAEVFGIDTSKHMNIKQELQDEKYDQGFYKAGYIYGGLEKSGKYNEKQLDFARDYLLNKAKNANQK